MRGTKGSARKYLTVGGVVVLLLTVVFYIAFDLHHQDAQLNIGEYNRLQMTQLRALIERMKTGLTERANGLRIIASMNAVRTFDLPAALIRFQQIQPYISFAGVEAISLADSGGRILISTNGLLIGNSCGVFSPGRPTEAFLHGPVFLPALSTGPEAGPQTPARYQLSLPIICSIPAAGGDSVPLRAMVSFTLNLGEWFSGQLHKKGLDSLQNIWVVDTAGTLLFHSSHPEMIRNSTQARGECLGCHESFLYTDQFRTSSEGSFQYNLKNRPVQVAAYERFSFSNVSWTVVHTTPYDAIVRIENLNFTETLALLVAVVLLCGLAIVILLRVRRQHMRAMLDTAFWRDKAMLERTLRETEMQYHTLFDNMLNGFARCKMLYRDGVPDDFIYLEVNKQFETLTGLKDILGQRVTEIIPGIRETNPEIFIIYDRVARTGVPETFEIFLEVMGVWFEVTAYSPERDYFNAIFNNITVRKQAELAVRESEEKYRTLFDHARDAVYTLSREGTFLSMNPACERLTGWRMEEFLGRNFIDFVQEDDRQTAVDIFTRLLQGEVVPTFELRVIHKTGTVVHGEFSSTAIMKEGRPTGVLGIGRDITDRKRNEDTLRQLFRAVQQSPASIVITDRDGRIEYVNPKFTSVTGYTPEEVAGKNLNILKSGVTPPEQYRAMWDTILAGGEWRGEFHNRKKNGELFWESAVISPIRDQQGTTTHFLGIKEDITEFKKIQESLVASEKNYRELFNSVPEAIIIEGEDGTILDLNESAAAMHLMTKEEIMRGRHEDLLAAGRNDFTDIEAIYRNVRRSRDSVLFEAWGKRKNGEEFPLEIRLRAGSYFGQPVVIGVGRDLTRNKEAERALRNSEERFSTVFFSSPLAITITQLDGTYLDVNEKFTETLGYLREDVIGRTSLDVGVWYNPAERVEVFRSLMANGYVNRKDVVFRAISGDLHHCRLSMTLLNFGNSTGVLSVIDDITDLKKAEEQVIQSEEKFRTITEQLADMVFLADAQGSITFVSPAAAGMFSCTPQEIIGAMMTDLTADDKSDRLLREYSSIVMAGTPVRSIILTLRRKDGSRFRGELNATRYRSGDRIGTLGVLRDITSREDSETRIREQAALLDSANDAIYVAALDDTLRYRNSAAERLFDQCGIRGNDRRISELYAADDEAFHRAMEGVRGDGNWTGELTLQDAAGHKRILFCRWTLLRSGEGTPESVFAINSDVTDKKQLEQQLFRAQRLESIGVLAGGIAHDLNNILAPVLLSISAIRQRTTDDKILGLLTTMENNVTRGADLIRQVLSFARGVEGKRTVVQARHLIREIERVIRETFPKSVVLAIDVPKDLWTVAADSTQLYQVLMNLCVNARDAMPGGGHLTIRARNTVIDAQYVKMNMEAKEGQYVMIEVADSGIGVPPDAMGMIFEPFFTTKEVGKGTGLGLSTVLAIVRSHGGFVEVSSVLRKGSQFRVYMPADRRPIPVASGRRDEPPAGAGELILVVDDEESILEIMKGTLEANGYSVLTARDGTGALAVFAKHAPAVNLVITDVMMPYLDGLGTMKAIRQMNPDVRFIAISGLEPGAYHWDLEPVKFLQKPFTSGDLLVAVHETLRRAGT